MVCEKNSSGNGAFKVDNVKELVPYPASVALAEYPGAERSVDVLGSRLLQLLNE